MARSSVLLKFLDFLAVAAGFAIATEIYRALYPSRYGSLTSAELFGGAAVSIAMYWVILRIYDGTGPEDTVHMLIDHFCFGTGLNLILQALLNYFQVLTRSMFLIVTGGLFATVLLLIVRLWLIGRVRDRGGVLLVGVTPLALHLARALRRPILGALGTSATPEDVPSLGSVDRLKDIVDRQHPAYVLVTTTADVPPFALARYRLAGGRVREIPALYESLYQRVYCQALEPAELLLSPALRADSRTLAIQSIYTNLIGLLLLIAVSPIFLIVLILVKLSGRGPALEGMECAGFQNIPFRLFRFRTLRWDGSGRLTGIGRVLLALRLANLPRLVNIVRGEIALFGPAPVRREFAQRLTALMPFYALRFSVKPGLTGWADVHLRGALQACEILRTEYDLYYVKEGSPLFDLEVLFRRLSGQRGDVATAIGLAEAHR